MPFFGFRQCLAVFSLVLLMYHQVKRILNDNAVFYCRFENFTHSRINFVRRFAKSLVGDAVHQLLTLHRSDFGNLGGLEVGL